MTTFVLVHGAYHGAWCWHKVVPELEARGYAAVAFDLPAHGIDTTPEDAVTLADYADRVCAAVDAADGDVVLVGHSMAGMVVTAAAERRPGAVDTLVYLTAYLPADGASMVDHRVEGSLISRRFTADESRGVGVVDPDALEELFYADCSAADLALARALVRPEPLGPLSTPVSFGEAYESVRRVYVGCAEDRAITRDQQERMVAERGVDAEFLLEASHSPFLSVPERTADVLDAAAGAA